MNKLVYKTEEGTRLVYEDEICIARINKDGVRVNHESTVFRSNLNDTTILHSIIREDGVEFTVGDKVNYTATNNTSSRIIERFSIIFSVPHVWFVGAKKSVHINSIEDIKCLFKTQEGNKIYKGDTYYCVNTAPHLWSLYKQTARDRTSLNKGVLAFTNLNNAENYINENKKEMEDTRVVIGYDVKPEFKEVAEKLFSVKFCRTLGGFHMAKASPECKKAKDALVLDLWFTKVYGQPYKVGDWVYAEKGKNEFRPSWAIPIFQIQEIIPAETEGFNVWLRPVSGDSTGTPLNEKVRLATPEEIEDNTLKLPMISVYEGKVVGSELVYGCQSVPLAMFDAKKCSITSVEIKGVRVGPEKIDKIVRYLKFNKLV